MKMIPQSLRGVWALLALAGVLLWGTAPLRAAEEHAAAPTAGAHAEAAPTEAAAGTAEGHEAPAVVPVFSLKQFAFSYLTAYMFCLSLCLGSLFLLIMHHLFDAGWSVSVRRVPEQLASMLFPHMFLLLLPILALQNQLYKWLTIDPATDHALDVKKALFNRTVFNILVPFLVLSWGFMAHRFRSLSLAQDKDGAAIWTRKARVLSAWGIYWFAFSLTLGCFYLMKSLQYQFFSTMYGVYYFAGSVWVTWITVWVLALILQGRGPLQQVVHNRQILDLGVLFFAFTVFYAYIHFSQYFLIWNASMPEETFWYVRREHGTWKWVGFTILFGHFFVPFLALLNQDVKLKPAMMLPIAGWAWLMHYVDMTFNVMPVLSPAGLNLTFWDPLLWFGMTGILLFGFWKRFHASPAFPLRDPRLKEAVTHHEIPPAPESASAAVGVTTAAHH